MYFDANSGVGSHVGEGVSKLTLLDSLLAVAWGFKAGAVEGDSDVSKRCPTSSSPGESTLFALRTGLELKILGFSA